jgi:hypothetical protein
VTARPRPKPDPQLDRHLIRELVDLYADAVTYCLWDKLPDMWTEDAYWEALEPFNISASGRNKVLSVTRAARERNGFVAQMPHSLVIDSLGSNEATAHHSLHLLARNQQSSGYSCFGRYSDVLIRDNGRWRFRRRSFRPIWYDSNSPGGTLIESAVPPWSNTGKDRA